jgi:hypothetical protein
MYKIIETPYTDVHEMDLRFQSYIDPKKYRRDHYDGTIRTIGLSGTINDRPGKNRKGLSPWGDSSNRCTGNGSEYMNYLEELKK